MIVIVVMVITAPNNNNYYSALHFFGLHFQRRAVGVFVPLTRASQPTQRFSVPLFYPTLTPLALKLNPPVPPPAPFRLTPHYRITIKGELALRRHSRVTGKCVCCFSRCDAKTHNLLFDFRGQGRGNKAFWIFWPDSKPTKV